MQLITTTLICAFFFEEVFMVVFSQGSLQSGPWGLLSLSFSLRQLSGIKLEGSRGLRRAGARSHIHSLEVSSKRLLPSPIDNTSMGKPRQKLMGWLYSSMQETHCNRYSLIKSVPKSRWDYQFGSRNKQVCLWGYITEPKNQNQK